MTYFTKPADLAALTKARSVDLNNLSTLIAAAFGKLPLEPMMKGGYITYGVDTGAVNALAVSVFPATLTGLVDGMNLRVRVLATTTSATPTLNLNGLGAIPIVRRDGSALAIGDISAGINEFSYDASLGKWTTNVGGAKGDKGDKGDTGNAVLEIPRVARTANTMLDAAIKGSFVDITSGTFTQTFAACATLGNRWSIFLRNSGSGNVTLDPNGVETIDGLSSLLMSPGEVRIVQCDGTALFTILIAGVNYQEFTSSGSWVKPPGATVVYVEVINGGSSGAASSTSSPAANDVSGGAGGARIEATYKASDLPSSVSVVVGAGGAAVAMTSSGGSGNVGGTSSFNGLSPLASPTYSTVHSGALSGATPTASCHKGGAGGGNISAGSPVAAGTSKLDGNGGAAIRIASGSNVTASPGTEPGGGGGAASAEFGFTATSGAGGKGRVRVWAW